MRWMWFAMALGGCTESWIYAPDAEATFDVAAEIQQVDGIAELVYQSDGLPPLDEEVSNALRMQVHTDGASSWSLSYPEADPGDLKELADNAVNLVGVYERCGASTCRIEVPFRAARSGTEPEQLRFEGDAIVTRQSATRRWDRIQDTASLTFVFPEE